MKKISILGIGWLGESLAKTLLEGKHQVRGTVSSETRAESLRKLNIHASSYRLGDNLSGLEPFLEADVFVITIPPSAAKPNYAKRLIELLSVIKNKRPNSKLFYTSSTSVYGSQPRRVEETAKVEPQSENARSICEVEEFLLSNFKHATVLRLGGLVGTERHPVHYLAGRENLKQAKAAVNLVHQNEVVQTLLFLLALAEPKSIYNVVCPEHPNKKKYYQTVAENLKLSLPNFDANDNTDNKTVFPRSLLQDGYKFIYQSPYDFPEAKA